MRTVSCKILAFALMCAGGLVFGSPSLVAARNHVVSPAELQKATTSSAATRQENQAKVETFFSSKLARQALESAHLNSVQIKSAIPSLNNQELARLASKADKTQANFAAGALTTEQTTIIIIAAAIVIIVIAAT